MPGRPRRLAVSGPVGYTFAMPDGPGDLTLRTLLELQGELRVMRRELAQAHSDLSKRLAALTNSVDGNAAVLDAITGLVRKRRARITATDNL